MHVAGPGLRDEQAAVDQVFGGVGPDVPQAHTALEDLALPVDVLHGGLALDDLAWLRIAAHGEDAAVLTLAAEVVGLVGEVAAGVDGARLDGHAVAGFVAELRGQVWVTLFVPLALVGWVAVDDGVV